MKLNRGNDKGAIMKTFLITLCILAMATIAWSSPFLICDCQDNVEQYILIFDGGTPIISDAVSTDCTGDQKRCSFDVGPLGLTDGTHHIEGAAKNIWEESAYVPFDFNKAVPSSGTGIGLSATP